MMSCETNYLPNDNNCHGIFDAPYNTYVVLVRSSSTSSLSAPDVQKTAVDDFKRVMGMRSVTDA